MSTTAKEEKKKSRASVPPFVVEARTPRNQDLLIQNLGSLRLRGAVSATVSVFARGLEQSGELEEGETLPAPARLFPGVGDLPGEQLYVNPATGEWKTNDPLYKQEGVLERVRRAIKRHSGMSNVGETLRGQKPRSGRLDEDTMKTLCAELLCFLDAGEAKLVKGVAPTREDVDELPGRYLLNWTNRSNWNQPKYADQLDRWTRKLNDLDGA